MSRILLTSSLLGAAAALSGCGNLVARSVGNVLAEDSLAYAGDPDVEFVGAAVPFGLKSMESLLHKVPKHRPLLTAAARGFTQYAYVYVQLPADELEDVDVAAAYAQRARAKRLYLRARDYGLRSLGIDGDQARRSLYRDPRGRIGAFAERELAALYWTGVAWSAAIALGKDEPALVAELPIVDALIERAAVVDPDFDAGGLHTFLISYAMGKPDSSAAAPAVAKAHFERAVTLSSGQQVAPYVALAESVAVSTRDRKAFEHLLAQALAIDPDARVGWRLANHVMQRRARWLLARTDTLFLE